MTHTTTQFDELEWRAFRYLTGELTPSEASLFESSLEQDLSACEALARITEVIYAARQMETRPMSVRPVNGTSLPSRTAPHSRAIRWAGVSLATISMAMLVALFVSRSGSRTTPPNLAETVPLSQAAELISHWNADESASPDDMLNLPAERPEEIFGDLDEVATVPSWMIAALSLENAEELTSDSSSEPVRSVPELKEN